MNKKIEVGRAFSQAWGIYKQHWLFFVGVLFSMAGINLLLWFLQSLVEDFGYLTVFLMSIATSLVGLILSVGLIRITIKAVDGQKLTLADLFSPANLILKIIGINLIILLLAILGVAIGTALVFAGITFVGGTAGLVVTALGILLGVFILIYLALRFYFALYILADKESGVFACLRGSGAMVRHSYFPLIGLMFLSVIYNILGFFALTVGLLISIPFTALAQAAAYRQLSGGDLAEAMPQPVPSAPIAPAVSNEEVVVTNNYESGDQVGNQYAENQERVG